MKNILIVESINDKAFFEGLLAHLQVQTVNVLEIYALEEGLSLKTLENTLKTRTIRIKHNTKIGFLIDADYEGKGEGIMEGGIKNRLKLVNTAVENVFHENPNFDKMCCELADFKSIAYKMSTLEQAQIQVACHFVNIGGKGNLETLLMELVHRKNAHIANCLEKWRECYTEKFKQNLIDQKLFGDLEKDLDKNWVEFCKKYDIPLAQTDYESQWVDFYKKYDVLSKDERTQARINTSMKTIMVGREDKKDNFISPSYSRFFDLNNQHPDFQSLCNFLKCFKD